MASTGGGRDPLGCVPRAAASDRGATAIEYALIAALVAGVIAATVGAVGQQVLALFATVPIPFG
jgi:Flp pilus assembly pilin Flp